MAGAFYSVVPGIVGVMMEPEIDWIWCRPDLPSRLLSEKGVFSKFDVRVAHDLVLSLKAPKSAIASLAAFTTSGDGE